MTTADRIVESYKKIELGTRLGQWPCVVLVALSEVAGMFGGFVQIRAMESEDRHALAEMALIRTRIERGLASPSEGAGEAAPSDGEDDCEVFEDGDVVASYRPSDSFWLEGKRPKAGTDPEPTRTA